MFFNHFVDRPDGRICYACAGAGPPVMLVQGAGVVGEGWRPQVEELADRYTLIWFDNRGIGGSTCRAVSLSIEAMAQDALAIADAEGIERFHLAGHSMGGLIAQQIALTSPRRVLSLSFLCTFLRGREAARVTPAILLSAVRMHVGTRAMRRRAFMRLVMPDGYLRQADQVRLAEELGALFGRDLADQPSIVMQQLRAMSRFDVSSRLEALAAIPTVVVSAALDRIALPKYGRSLAAAIPGARYVEIDQAGHGVTIQRADVVNALLSEHFATSVNSQPPTPNSHTSEAGRL
jgi:aminoacrylate hydrolase